MKKVDMAAKKTQRQHKTCPALSQKHATTKHKAYIGLSKIVKVATFWKYYKLERMIHQLK